MEVWTMAKSSTYTANAFLTKMDAFIAFCESEGVDATDYQLIKFFGISPPMLEKYRAADRLKDGTIRKSGGFYTAMKKLELYREDAAIRQLVSDPKLASHCGLRLRQPHWGGWSDKGEAAQDLQFRIKLGDGDRELME
jgi:hypothetical protein